MFILTPYVLAHCLDPLPEKIHTSQTLEWTKNSDRTVLKVVWALVYHGYLCHTHKSCLSIILSRGHTKVSLLGTIIYDVFKVVVLFKKLIYSEEVFFFFNETQTFHVYCIIPHVLAATNMKWIEAKMKVSVRNKHFTMFWNHNWQIKDSRT